MQKHTPLRSLKPDQQQRALGRIEKEQRMDLLPEVEELLITTSDHGVRDAAALVIERLGDERTLDALLSVIRDEKTRGHRSTLIWACERYDCTLHLPIFVNLVIQEPYGAAIEAYAVVEAMEGPSPTSMYDESVSKLEEALQKQSFSPEHREIVEATLDLLKSRRDELPLV